MDKLAINNKVKLDHQVKRSSILARATAIVVGILLAVFFVTTMSSITTILEKMDTVKNDPFQITAASGKVETALVQIRTVCMRSIYDNSSTKVQDLRLVFQSADRELEESFTTMSSSNFVDSATLQSLRSGCESLKQRQDQLVQMCEDPNTTTEQIRDYVTYEIYPLIGGLLQLNTDISKASMHSLDEAYIAVNDACRQTIFIICILMIAVTVSIFVYLSILHRKSQREEILAKSLQETLEMAQSANVAKSTFLSSMSHDIRTPMNAIVGLTTIAEQNIDNREKVAYCLDGISLSSKHLLRLVNDVLDMSEIESGKISLSAEPFYFPEFMKEILSVTEYQATSKGLHLEVNIGDIKHNYLIGDKVRLGQMMMNLISNAVKYTKTGGHVYIDITEEPNTRTENQTTDKGEGSFINFRFVVEDTGIGMDSDFMTCIFEPFERERNETTPFTEGAGLGMTITKNVVDMMKGSITVESTVGVGSRFTVILPLQIAKEDAKLIENQSVTAVRGYGLEDFVAEDKSGSDLNSLDDPNIDPVTNAYNTGNKLSGRLLLVEDDALNREIATELIKTVVDIDIDIACDGLEALNRIRGKANGYYDLVFMDCQMPIMGGTEAAKEIRKFEKEHGRSHLPIIAMTANVLDEDRARTIQAGMDGFLAKPINLKELKRTLNKYLTE